MEESTAVESDPERVGAGRVVVAGMPAAGHVNPSVPLVRELVRRGVQVTYYSTDEFGDPIERSGAEFRPYPAGTISAQLIAEATRSGGPVRVVARALSVTGTLVSFLQDELRTRRPTAVAFDSNAIWGRMAAASLDLPMISLMTTMIAGSGELKGLTFREWVHLVRTSVADVPAVRAARRRVLQQFGAELFPPRPVFPMLGDVTIFPIPRWLQPDNPRIDATCHFVGATIDPDTRDRGLDAELAAHVDGPEPLVLVSLGTLHAAGDEFFRTCFQALGDLPARVLLVAGSATDPARLGRPPANTLIRRSVPQLEVLRHAAVFVTHAGMNSALEGLYHGVPLVVVPQQFEQLIIGRTIADRGAATVLRHNLSNRPVPAGELRAAVRRALTDESQRTAARSLAGTLSEGGGAPAGADAIQKLLAAHR